MKIDLNKDLERDYPEEFYAGFTMKQCVVAFIALAVSLGAGFAIWHYTGLDVVECTYISIPVAIPICAVGFYEYHLQTPFKMLREILYYRKTRRLHYKACEMPAGRMRIFTMKRKITFSRKKKS